MADILDWLSVGGRTAFEHTLLAIWFAAFVSTGWLFFKYVRFVHWTKWWDPSLRKHFYKLNWDEINDIIVTDPTEYKERFRKHDHFSIIKSAIIFLFYFTVFTLVFRLIKTYALIISAESIEHLATSIGVASLAMAAFGYFVQTRVSTRSMNRQKWINQIRRVLDPLIAEAPRHDAEEDELNHAIKKYIARHARLELLLNPAEKEHRALLGLLRRIYRMGNIPMNNSAWQALCLAGISPEDEDQWVELKSRIVRLSNAVLKREWEQVKHVR